MGFFMSYAGTWIQQVCAGPQVQSLGGEAVLRQMNLGPIALPNMNEPPTISDLCSQVCRHKCVANLGVDAVLP